MWIIGKFFFGNFKVKMMDPNVYFKYFPIETSKTFFEDLVSDPYWTGFGRRTVMDLGCGPGNMSTRWIDHFFPDVERIVGIDVDPAMIRFANEKNTNEKIEYHVGDILKMESLDRWTGRIDRLVSTFVFHRLRDQKRAFRNLFDLLAPHGMAALRFVVQGPFYFAFRDLLKTHKWKSILEATNFILPESMVHNYDKEFYKKLLEDIGFSVHFISMGPSNVTYETDEECKNLLLSLHYIGNVSDELKQEYTEDLFRKFVEYSPRNSEGRLTHLCIHLDVKFTKRSFNS